MTGGCGSSKRLCEVARRRGLAKINAAVTGFSNVGLVEN